ncbi:MAG: response regulator [Chrysiogenetes bacterium]|nr:response regulator [Chrysiogenetes bacterium]
MELAELSTGLLRQAVAAYMDLAWEGATPPERTSSLASLTGLADDASAEELLAWEGFEREGTNGGTRRVQLRLGNARYPHMKLSLERLRESGQWVFSVDTHDRHLPPEALGASFAALQQSNEELKMRIEQRWADLGLDTARARLRDFVAREGDRPEQAQSKGYALLVDDDPDILDVERIVVERAGYHALLAASGDEALEKAEACGCQIALALVDIMMPGKSGYELVEELRSKKALSGPVLFLTAMMAGTVRDELCDKVLHKPFDIEELRQTMKAALARA